MENESSNIVNLGKSGSEISKDNIDIHNIHWPGVQKGNTLAYKPIDDSTAPATVDGNASESGPLPTILVGDEILYYKNPEKDLLR